MGFTKYIYHSNASVNNTTILLKEYVVNARSIVCTLKLISNAIVWITISWLEGGVLLIVRNTKPMISILRNVCLHVNNIRKYGIMENVTVLMDLLETKPMESAIQNVAHSRKELMENVNV